jgi:hypothetical protein
MNNDSGTVVMPAARQYPNILPIYPPPRRPLSFICVRFSEEFEHNIVRSCCVHDELNEFIVIENTGNIYYPTLGKAIEAGIAKATNELLVIVHEDIVLLPNWQAMFEHSLAALERENSDWAVVGLFGWDVDGALHGHVSDPHSYRKKGLDTEFAEVSRVDEMVFVLRRTGQIFPDPRLPSIHNIGRDLARQAAILGLKSYVVDAPPIHKYADELGNLILNAEDSAKIAQRQTLTYMADETCSNEYLVHKWKDLQTGIASFDFWYDRHPDNIAGEQIDINLLNTEQKDVLLAPIILLGKGGGGSRLLSLLAQSTELFIGNKVGPGGDTLELVQAIYTGLLRKYQYSDANRQELIIPELQAAAARMLAKANWPRKWGFKLPESLFVLSELVEAFPNARFVYLSRDPLATTLRRTHMTARLDNKIGQVTLPLAYDFLGISRERIHLHDDTTRMAIATAHQIELVIALRESTPETNWTEIKFNQLIENPGEVIDFVCEQLGLTFISDKLSGAVNARRAGSVPEEIPAETIAIAHEILGPARKSMGYV